VATESGFHPAQAIPPTKSLPASIRPGCCHKSLARCWRFHVPRVLPKQGYHHSSFIIDAPNSSNLLIAATSTMNTQSRKPSQLASLFCGVTAGAVEGGITYPTEFVKTQAQFSTTKGQPVSVWKLEPGSSDSAEPRSDHDPRRHSPDTGFARRLRWFGRPYRWKWVESGSEVHDV
jgi:hypothetical protein